MISVSGPLLVAAVLAFAATTVDDLLILTALFAAHRTGSPPRPRQIVTGQYAGFLAILAVAAVIAAGLASVPTYWVGLLGLIPIAFGIRGLLALRHPNDDRPPLAASASQIAVLTFANGADNIGVFTPLLRTLGVAGSATAIGLFLVLIAGWCAAGALLAAHPLVTAAVRRTGHLLIPLVFLAIGVLILVSAGTAGWLIHRL